MSMTIELKEDGTAVAVVPGEEEAEQGTWTTDGDKVTVDIDESPIEFTLRDGNLIVEEDSMKMVFSQEAPEAEAFVPAEPVAADEADFVGNWTVYRIGMNGAYYPASILGGDITAVIESGSITLDGFLFSNTTLPLVYADGAMSFAAESDDGMVGSLTVQMLEDGTLALAMDAGESGSFSFYMNHGEAAEEAPAA